MHVCESKYYRKRDSTFKNGSLAQWRMLIFNLNLTLKKLSRTTKSEASLANRVNLRTT